MKPSLVLSSAPDMESARTIAGVLLDRKLAACVSLVPGAESHYVWEGKREQTAEVLILIKAPTAHWPKLRDEILAVHPYDCPEILQLDLSDGLPKYLEWLFQSTLQEP